MPKRAKATLGCLAVAAALTLSAGGSASAENYWQCVPFARMISGIQMFGDAWTWWQQAAGKYAQGFTPKAGAVLVFKPNGVMNKGHVAVVSQVLTDRDHPGHPRQLVGDRRRPRPGRDATSPWSTSRPHGDWSQVKVWYDPVARPRQDRLSDLRLHLRIGAECGEIGRLQCGPGRGRPGHERHPVACRGAGQGLASVAADATYRIAALIQSLTDR